MRVLFGNTDTVTAAILLVGVQHRVNIQTYTNNLSSLQLNYGISVESCKQDQDGFAQVQEMAEMLRGVSQRLSDGERTWEGEKRSLEGQLNRTQHSMREAQACADQLRWALLNDSTVDHHIWPPLLTTTVDHHC